MLLSRRVKFLLSSAILLAAVSATSTAMAGAYLPNDPEVTYLTPTGPGGTWSFYQMGRTANNWADMQADLAATTDTRFGTGAQAKLPTVHTSEQFKIAAQMTWRIGGQMWVGASDAASEGTWTWQDGTAFYDESTGTSLNGWANYWDATSSQPVGGSACNYAIMADLDVDAMQTVPDIAVFKYYYTFETGASGSTPYTNPQSLTAPTGTMVLDPNTGRYYELVTEDLNFHAAKVVAESHTYNGVQGRLVMVNDESENSFVTHCGNRRRQVWTGLTDDPLYGGTESTDPIAGWVWAGPNGGTPLSTTGYVNWRRDGDGNFTQPNNSSGEDNYVLTDSDAETWNDVTSRSTGFALVEYGQDQEVAKGFLHRRTSGVFYDVSNTRAATDLLNHVTPAFSGQEATYAQTATLNFSDTLGAGELEHGYMLGTTSFPNDGKGWDDNYYALKSYVTVNIPAAGTYTFGGFHDDAMELTIDRGDQPAITQRVEGWPEIIPGWDDRGFGTVVVHFDAPGNYNIYSTYAERYWSSGVELAVASGDYSIDINSTTEEEYWAIRDAFVANAALVGDTLNGGLAVRNLRQIHTQSGFTINQTTTASTLNLGTTGNRVAGSFGNEDTMTTGDAITATTQLVVPENSGGWWTLGVTQSQEGTLTILKDGQVVACSQASGNVNGAAVATNGALAWNAPSVGHAGKALGAYNLAPGTYEVVIDYNPNNQTGTFDGLTVSDFNVIHAEPTDGLIENIEEAINFMIDARDNGTGSADVAAVASGTYSTINFDENGGNSGHFGNTERFPLYPSGQSTDVSNGTLITADITVSAEDAGFWTFAVNTDDGFQMQLSDEYGNVLSFNEMVNVSGGSGGSIFMYDGGRNAAISSIATVDLSEGTYELMMVQWDINSGSACELSYAQGEHLVFDADFFNLLGSDEALESLELFAAAGIHSEFNGAFDLLGDALAFEDQSQWTGETPKIAGDANSDGKVDGSDVTILANNWQYGVTGTANATWAMGDFNGDGMVDGSDVTILANNWQYGVTAAAAAVPEPGTLVLLLGVIASLMLIRRKK